MTDPTTRELSPQPPEPPPTAEGLPDHQPDWFKTAVFYEVLVRSFKDSNGDGYGDSVNDIVVVDDVSFRLRAERSGSGDGRTYTVTYEVEDDCGNTATASATVEVPINNSGGNKGNEKFR